MRVPGSRRATGSALALIAAAVFAVINTSAAAAQTATTSYVPSTTSTTAAPGTTTSTAPPGGTTTTVRPGATTTTVTTPPGATTTSTVAICPAPNSVDLGTIPQGGSGTGVVGPFTPTSTAQMSLNGGNNFGSTTTDARGCATVTVTVQSSGTAAGLPLFAAQGLQLAQSNAVVTINGVSGLSARPGGQVNTVTLTGTFNGQTVTRTVLFRVQSARAAASGLSRTGATILQWSIVGALLLAAGAAFVYLSRRRGSLG